MFARRVFSLLLLSNYQRSVLDDVVAFELLKGIRIVVLIGIRSRVLSVWIKILRNPDASEARTNEIVPCKSQNGSSKTENPRFLQGIDPKTDAYTCQSGARLERSGPKIPCHGSSV